jgi:hypothetical protein
MRIKLFEAFNNSDKIDKVNELLIYWAVKSYFNEKNLTMQIVDNGEIVIEDCYKIRLATYSPDDDNIEFEYLARGVEARGDRLLYVPSLFDQYFENMKIRIRQARPGTKTRLLIKRALVDIIKHRFGYDD